MKARYFAWVRERIGKGEEDLDLPAEVVTVADFLLWLSHRGENYAYALENANVIRVALDQRHVRHEAKLGGTQEIALFPPMTGG